MKKLIWIFALAALAAFGGGKDTSGNAITENTLLGNVDGEQTKVGDINALKVETDPTVPSWAKTTEKPHYTAGEVGARPNDWMPSAVDVGAATPGGVTNIVTNVVTKAYVDSLGVSGSITTNDVCNIVTNDVGGTWTTGRKTPESYLPSCAITNTAVRWNSSASHWEIYVEGINDGMAVDGWYTGYVYDFESVNPFEIVNTDYNSLTVTVGKVNFSSDIGRCVYATRASATRNALGLAYERDIPASISNNVPSWAMSSTPPESMTDNAVVLTNSALKTKGGALIAASAIDNAVCSTNVDGAGTIGKIFQYGIGTLVNKWGSEYAEYAQKALEASTATSTTKLGNGAGAAPYPRYLQFAYQDNWDANGGQVYLVSANPITSAETVVNTNAWVSDLAPISADNANTRAIVTQWESFLDGSNVVFSITNYISGTYSTDYAKLRILELRDGVYREIYDSHCDITNHITAFKNGDFRTATNQVITAVNAAVANKADKDWGKYTSAGGNAPSNTVYMTAPNTVFAGGMEYERVAVGEGAVCVLTTKGAPVWTQGDEGTFKFQDDGGTNYFGFAKTDSYVIGCDTDGISVNNQIVTLTYNVTMSGVPCIWYKADLTSNTAWEQLNLPDGTAIAGASHVVSWESTPAAGTEVCYIDCTEAKGFFKATIEVAGSAKFMTNMPADFSAGILCTDGVHKVSFDWNNGSPRLIGVE